MFSIFLDEDRNEIIRQNQLINQANREEIMKYEESSANANRNRLNLQQQPYKSEFEYYNRLKEIERTNMTQYYIKMCIK